MQCGTNAVALKRAPEHQAGRVDLVEALRGWSATHRPVLAQGLQYAIDLHLDVHAYEHKVLLMLVQYQPNATQEGKKFKVVGAEATPLSKLVEALSVSGISTLPEQLKLMGVEARKVGMLGTGAVILICKPAAEHAGGSLVMPVSFEGPWVDVQDVPPPGWMTAMINDLNKD